MTCIVTAANGGSAFGRQRARDRGCIHLVPPPTGAFTLMELMIVIGLMAIVMATGVPIAYKIHHREALNQAVRDVTEVLSNARSMAILRGKMTEVLISPRERRLYVSAATLPKASTNSDQEPLEPDQPQSPPPVDSSGLSAQLADSLTVEMLDVNLVEYKDAEAARVRFYPNGTCDEFTLILHSDKGEWIKISLEITTSLASVGPVDR